MAGTTTSRSSLLPPRDTARERRRPLHVFHLIKSLGRGGAEMLLSEGLRLADRDRFLYTYGYFLPWKTAMVGALESSGGEVTCFNARTHAGVLLSAARIARHLKSNDIDLLHCHLPLAGIVGRVAGRMAGVPVVYTEHNKLERYNPLTRRLNLATWGWQDRVVAVSGDVADSIAAHGAAGVRVDVVLNGVDVDHFRPDMAAGAAVRRRLAIPDWAPVLGTVAVFRTQKRLDEWLEAASLLKQGYPEARFILVGDGPLREDLGQRASALGFADAVHFVGLQEEVRPYLSAMDVYMMSSIFEGLPIALLEAMAMERVIVATAVGGIPEAITHGHDGFLVPAGEPQALAEAAAGALSDPARSKRCGAEARRTVEDRFSMLRMTRDLEALYLEVLVENGRSH